MQVAFNGAPMLIDVLIAGSLADVTYIQRLRTKGGVVPEGLFTLPAFSGVPNHLLDVPYQADYLFLVPQA